MLCKEASRFSAKEVVQHPWFDVMVKSEGVEESKAKQQLISRALFNLKHFSTKSKIKQSALGYLIQHFMNVSDTMELEQVFQALDTSGEGFLTKQELLEGYRKFYGHDFNEAEIDALMTMAD